MVKKIKAKLAARPEHEAVLRSAVQANKRAVRALRGISRKNLVRRLDSLDLHELDIVLTEIALEKPELISAIKKYKERRFPLPAYALTTDATVLTAIANDLGFEYIFSRQLEALAKLEDLVIGLSTSGNSLNVLNALRLAKKRGIKSVAFTGGEGGKIVEEELADIIINIPAQDVTHIQEGHETAFHAICDVVEEILFSERGLVDK